MATKTQFQNAAKKIKRSPKARLVGFSINPGFMNPIYERNVFVDIEGISHQLTDTYSSGKGKRFERTDVGENFLNPMSGLDAAELLMYQQLVDLHNYFAAKFEREIECKE